MSLARWKKPKIATGTFNMKLTELIAELQQFQKEYGEMDVEWERATEFIDGNRVILWRAAGLVDGYMFI